MLFQLHSSKHEIEKIHELLTQFFTKIADAETAEFSNSLFPTWVNDDIMKGKLKENFEGFFHRCKTSLSQDEVSLLSKTFLENNDIIELCLNKAASLTGLDDLPQNISAIVDFQVTTGKNLFQWLYSYILTSKDSPILKTLNTSLNDHFESFQSKNPSICTFCGLETYTLIDTEGRPDYDHYLNSSQYPFSAVNLNNLFPMGLRCNQRVKGADHILFDNFLEKHRRTSFYPYNSKYSYKDFEYQLECLEEPNISNGLKGQFNVSIDAIDKDDEVLKENLRTWVSVFDVEKRYAEEIRRSTKSWIDIIIYDSFPEVKETNPENNVDQNIDLSISENVKICKLTDARITSMVNLVPQFIFHQYLLENSSIIRALIKIDENTSSKVNMNWLN
ncbi:hypothetical protein DHW03_00925 [Pedobacter yonginense]|uniref:HNH endonuclease n=1 Tax=Pedobacter yonginense TaxID=651869 RepID=A0A317ERJ1_9SPHI|nr:hypothetical protein [Pedobacter yonginense]PWS28453.1 hypothetical protein DHW03_00925 [Pedobacter yonginense]